jgi:hypothetical protein
MKVNLGIVLFKKTLRAARRNHRSFFEHEGLAGMAFQHGHAPDPPPQNHGSQGDILALALCGQVMASVRQRVRAALPADIDSMAGTAGSLNLRIWADQGMQARATGPRHMAVRGSRLRYACRPMGNDPPESHHNQGHPDLHARSTVHTRRSEVASGGFTEPPTL